MHPDIVHSDLHTHAHTNILCDSRCKHINSARDNAFHEKVWPYITRRLDPLPVMYDDNNDFIMLTVLRRFVITFIAAIIVM